MLYDNIIYFFDKNYVGVKISLSPIAYDFLEQSGIFQCLIDRIVGDFSFSQPADEKERYEKYDIDCFSTNNFTEEEAKDLLREIFHLYYSNIGKYKEETIKYTVIQSTIYGIVNYIHKGTSISFPVIGWYKTVLFNSKDYKLKTIVAFKLIRNSDRVRSGSDFFLEGLTPYVFIEDNQEALGAFAFLYKNFNDIFGEADDYGNHFTTHTAIRFILDKLYEYYGDYIDKWF